MLGFWVWIDQKMIEKTLPQMALFAPHLAPDAPEMASAVTKMAVEMSAVSVGSARDWIDLHGQCVQSILASVSPLIGQVRHRCSSGVSLSEQKLYTECRQSRMVTAFSIQSIIGATEKRREGSGRCMEFGMIGVRCRKTAGILAYLATGRWLGC